MEIKQVFNIMNVISWVIFVGFCIKTASVAIVAFIGLFGNKEATKNLYMGIDLSNLYDFSAIHYTIAVLLFILVACLKAYVFYLLIKLFKVLDLTKPFKSEVVQLIFKLSYVALFVGILGFLINPYFTWLKFKVIFLQLDLSTSAYIFMAGVVFIVASLFRHATEIQSENELTI